MKAGCQKTMVHYPSSKQKINFLETEILMTLTSMHFEEQVNEELTVVAHTELYTQ